MTIRGKAIEQHFTVVLLVFQFYPVCKFGQFMNFGLGIVRSESVNKNLKKYILQKHALATVVVPKSRCKHLVIFTGALIVVAQLSHIPMDAGLSSIVWCSLSDPYAVMMTADGSLILLEFTLDGTEPKVKISRPQINQVCLMEGI